MVVSCARVYRSVVQCYACSLGSAPLELQNGMWLKDLCDKCNRLCVYIYACVRLHLPLPPR